MDSSFSDLVYEYAMSHANLIVAVLNRAGKIENANAYAEKVVGAQLRSKPFSDMVIDFQGTFSITDLLVSDRWPILLNIASAGGLPQTYYFHFYALDHRVMAVGQQDADELENMRRALIGLNNDLNNLTRQLQKKNALLEKLDAQKNQFFGMAAHDLRHPLGVIRMYSEFLADEVSQRLSAEHRQFLDHIQQSGALLEQILDDFLDISVFESGRLILKSETVKVGRWLANIIAYNRVLATRKDLHIIYDPKPPETDPPLTLFMDASKMEQVVNNLTSNAMKFSSPGEAIRVGLRPNASETIFSVRDSGPGIAEDDIPRLFHPYERVRTEQEVVEKSSGLGLAIVKKIVEAHDGRVWVESRPDHGSTFQVALPNTPSTSERRTENKAAHE